MTGTNCSPRGAGNAVNVQYQSSPNSEVSVKTTEPGTLVPGWILLAQYAAQLRPAADAELAVDRRDMGFHGPHADEQLSRGFAAGHAFRDLLGYALFRLGQRRTRPWNGGT